MTARPFLPRRPGAPRATSALTCAPRRRTGPTRCSPRIVHLPEGRLGNIIFRPVLRGHEIPYLGRAGAPHEQQMPVTDLPALGARQPDRPALALAGQGIVPRLTTAHNFAAAAASASTASCARCKRQGSARRGSTSAPSTSCRTGRASATGRFVLADQTLAARPPRAGDARRQDAGRAASPPPRRCARSSGCPATSLVVDGDNELPIDLDHVLAVEAFGRAAQGAARADLRRSSRRARTRRSCAAPTAVSSTSW